MSSFVSKRTLMNEAKARGLKGFSTMTKGNIVKLLQLDKSGQAPLSSMTAKRKKAVGRGGKTKSPPRISAVNTNPLLGLNPLASEVLLRPSTKRKKARRPPKPTFKPPPPPLPTSQPPSRSKKPRAKKALPPLTASQQAKLLSAGSSSPSASNYWNSISGQQIINLMENMSKAELVKEARRRKAKECKKYTNLQKKSVAQLTALL